jgi:hypothetical protein
MPQLSSTERLLMSAQDMTDTFHNPHPDVPFASVGYDTIAALADLAAIFKLNLQPTPSHASHASPPKVVQRPSHIPSTSRRRDHRRQFSLRTSPTGHYLRGWSPGEHSFIHLRGCPLAPNDSRLATFPKMTFAECTQPIWRLPSEVTIVLNGTMSTQSSIQPPARKWNTQLL